MLHNLPDLRLMTRAARLYHEEGLNQTEVAHRLGITQVAVSRLLKKAEEHGIVRTTVLTPPGTFADLEGLLEGKFWFDPGNRRRRHARFGGVRSECDRLRRGPIYRIHPQSRRGDRDLVVERVAFVDGRAHASTEEIRKLPGGANAWGRG